MFVLKGRERNISVKLLLNNIFITEQNKNKSENSNYRISSNLIFGIILLSKIGRIDPSTNLFHLGFHLFFGALIAWIIVNYKKELVKKVSLEENNYD